MWFYAPLFAAKAKPRRPRRPHPATKGDRLMRTTLTAATIALLAAPTMPTAQAEPPIVGGQGLVPNARALADYIRATYPGVISIGGVRPDRLNDHPSGRAIDVMIGNDMELGYRIRADIESQRTRFNISYILFRVPDHFDHLHFTVAY